MRANHDSLYKVLDRLFSEQVLRAASANPMELHQKKSALFIKTNITLCKSGIFSISACMLSSPTALPFLMLDRNRWNNIINGKNLLYY